MKSQKDEILSFVEDERNKGRSLSDILQNLKLSRTSYYRWRAQATAAFSLSRKKSSSKFDVTPKERDLIDKAKDSYPLLRHRQIQGLLQLSGNFISASSIYKHLKATHRIEPYHRREAPWKEARYEVYQANVMWGADWTKMRIGGVRWYLLTMIDFFQD